MVGNLNDDRWFTSTTTAGLPWSMILD